MCEREKFWIKELNTIVPNGYNITDGGNGGDNFTNHPNKEIIRQKIIKTLLGNTRSKGFKYPKERGEKYSVIFKGEGNPFYGKHHTTETKELLRKKSSGRKHSAETIQKMAKKLTGKKRSEESKLRYRNCRIGKIWITNGKIIKSIEQKYLKEYELIGFKRGKKLF